MCLGGNKLDIGGEAKVSFRFLYWVDCGGFHCNGEQWEKKLWGRSWACSLMALLLHVWLERDTVWERREKNQDWVLRMVGNAEWDCTGGWRGRWNGDSGVPEANWRGDLRETAVSNVKANWKIRRKAGNLPLAWGPRGRADLGKDTSSEAQAWTGSEWEQAWKACGIDSGVWQCFCLTTSPFSVKKEGTSFARRDTRC